MDMTIVAVVAITFGGLIKLAKMRHEARLMQQNHGAEYQGQDVRIRELEERVKVLESIVTDKAYDLKQKIASL